VITSVVVTYQVRPEAAAEHVRLIEAVFEDLLARCAGQEEDAGLFPGREDDARRRSARASWQLGTY
jgi:hypothetical protein